MKEPIQRTPEEWLRLYEAGELTSGERQFIDSWYEEVHVRETDLRAAEVRAGDLQSGDFRGTNARGAAKRAELESVWAQLEQRTAGASRRRVPVIRPVYWRVAAALMVVLAGMYLLARRSTSTAPGNAVASLRTVTSAAREVKKIVLPDSSVVWLNASSSLSFSADMDDDSVRLVRLTDGEAFFDIRQDAARPFQVVTGRGLVARVLGTSFDVRAYTADALAAVAVATGKVQVMYEGNLLPSKGMLTAGEALQIGDNGAYCQRYILEPQTAAGWRNGRLALDHSSLLEIAHTLERWYHVPIRVKAGANGTDRYNARFDHGVKLPEVLRLLSITENIKSQVLKDTIWISGK